MNRPPAPGTSPPGTSPIDAAPHISIDVLVVGSGVAGLSAAIDAAHRGLRTVVLTKDDLDATATRYAQGGVAAALTDDDSVDLHASDTLVAGVGLCDEDAVSVLVGEGPDRVLDLITMGAEFDREYGHSLSITENPLALAREGGHSLARILHAGGDATGAEIERALVAAVRRADVDLREGWLADELVVRDGRCVGIEAVSPSGERTTVMARHVVLASGGAGQLYAVTTNPGLSTGAGVAMALRHAVAVADVEFVQFHPTALHTPSIPRPLLSEALRGDGAILRDEQGVAFMAGEHPLADLAPRDVVSRAIARRLNDRGLEHVWLDATSIHDFPTRFPTIWASCQAVGLDPRSDWLPVAPAAHYLCGGVVTDLHGATSLPGLWACGEVACSGVHGANRLASNSLLDGLVFGVRAARAIAAGIDGPEQSGAMRGIEPSTGVLRSPVSWPPARVGAESPEQAWRALQDAMTLGAGVVRTAESLRATEARLVEIALSRPEASTSRHEASVRDMLIIASALVRAALAREESRGSHTRADFPETSSDWRGRLVHEGDMQPRFVRLPVAVER